MSASKSKSSNKTYNKDMAIKSLLSIPPRRANKITVPMLDLLLTKKLLNKYLKPPSHRAEPSKAQMHKTVSALLPKDAKPLSQKWNKTHLACAILHWVEHAISLGGVGDQSKATLEVFTTKDNPDLLEHQISTEQEDGIMELMQLSSPELNSPATKPVYKKVPIVMSPEFVSDEIEVVAAIESFPLSEFENDLSLMAHDDQVLDEFEELLKNPGLAITPTPMMHPEGAEQFPATSNGINENGDMLSQSGGFSRVWSCIFRPIELG